LPWIRPRAPVLGVHEGTLGRVRLVSWALAAAVQARIELLSAEQDDEAAADELLLLQDRYQRIEVDSDLRIDPPEHTLLHLEVASGAVFLARFPERLELWSVAYREARLARASREQEGLP